MDDPHETWPVSLKRHIAAAGSRSPSARLPGTFVRVRAIMPVVTDNLPLALPSLLPLRALAARTLLAPARSPNMLRRVRAIMPVATDGLPPAPPSILLLRAPVARPLLAPTRSPDMLRRVHAIMLVVPDGLPPAPLCSHVTLPTTAPRLASCRRPTSRFI